MEVSCLTTTEFKYSWLMSIQSTADIESISQLIS
uniref:Uncharacterized protein n=1 Tax=Arundo donax TaxID=35708 RepID=A0A0A9H0N8_ARUDO